MGLMELFSKKGASPEVAARIRNSECGQSFANTFCKFFVAGDAHGLWWTAKTGDLRLRFINTAWN